MNERNTEAGQGYVLGHTDREIERLKAQAILIDPITRRFFQEAGVGVGMRVLEVGSGAGDVAFLAAELVGASGEVIGVDVAPAAVAVAQSRATRHSVSNVSFRLGDPSEMTFDSPFDAVIGRYVLQFQSDPAKSLRKLAAQTRPGGLVVFHEIDWAGLASYPPVPSFDQCCRWGSDAMRRHGTEIHMGAKLHATFVSAGLGAPEMRLEVPIGGMPTGLSWLQMFKELIATLLPEMERLGVATAGEVDIESLVERISREATRSGSVILGHYQVGAWARR
jgi:SAM-dependent methyltransferase